jgi:PST family polysaccharide transporter
MNRFLRVTALLGSVTGLTLAVQIARTKLVALQVGKAGMALLAQFADLQNFISGFLLLGMEQGIVAVATDAYVRGDPTAPGRLIQQVWQRTSRWALPALILLALGSPWLVPAVTGQRGHVWVAATALGTLTVQLWVRPRTSILNGAKAFKLLARSRILEAVLGLAMVVPLAGLWRLSGALWSVAGTQVVSWVATWFVWQRLEPPAKVDGGLVSDTEIRQSLRRFGLASLIGLVIANGLSLALRRVLIGTIGLEQTGLYQVAYSLTQQYLGIVLNAMAMYSFTTYRAASCDPAALQQEVEQTLRGALLVITPIICVLLVSREWLIRLLFSADYLPAAEILRVQLVGDLFKVIAWAIGLPIVASGRLGVHVTLEFVFSSALVLGAAVWTRALGPVGAAWAFTANLVFACGVYLFVLRRTLDIGLTRELVKPVLVALMAVVVVALVANKPPVLRLSLSFATMTVWLAVSIQRSEWLQLRRVVRERLNRFS